MAAVIDGVESLARDVSTIVARKTAAMETLLLIYYAMEEAVAMVFNALIGVPDAS